MDSAGKKAGKGPLIAEEISHTLGTSQDQYLFQAVEEKSKAIGFMRGLGGVQTMNEKMPTLQADNGTSGNNQPLVVFSKIRRAKTTDDFETRGETGVCNTLNTFDNGDVRTNECVICMATQQGGAEILEDKSPTITAAAGMSGNNQPVICLQGNGIDRADTAGCNGRGWTENVSYTLNTIDRPAVAYCIGNGQVHDAVQMEKEICKTLNCMDDPMKVMIRK